MQAFTKYQREVLLRNSNILKITKNHVVYSPEFKIKAVESYHAGVPAKEIFIRAGINLEFFKDEHANHCIKRWKKKYKERGKDALKKEDRGRTKSINKGRSKKLVNLTQDELIAVVEIQREIIEELKKMKALARKKQ